MASECVQATLNTKYVTSLEGYVNSVIAEDPQECFERTFDNYYNGIVVLTALINNQHWPIHVCGSTNTGWYLDGCGHGNLADDPCTTKELTDDYVIAQGCIINCLNSNILDPSKQPDVLIAEIDDQWHILSVLDASSFSRDEESPDFCFDNLCCPIGGLDIRATVLSCGSFVGQSFILEARNGAFAWEGSLTIGGNTLSISMSCDVETGIFSIGASCDSTNLNRTEAFTVDCNGTGTGTGTESTTTISNLVGVFSSGGCCTDLEVSFEILDTKFINRCKYVDAGGTAGYLPTDEIVTAEACNLPNLQVDDEVIIAEVIHPDSGTGTTTGTATSTGTGTGVEEATRWHIIRACNQIDNCNECPPPPPPPTPCCGYTHLTAPETLTAVVTIDSNIPAQCVCPDDIVITFTLVPESDPPEWHQASGGDCSTPGTPGGSDDASVFSAFSGLIITCSGESGTNTATGTSGGRKFFLFYDSKNIPSINDSCNPLYMEFDFDATIQCVAYNQLDPITLTAHMEVMP